MRGRGSGNGKLRIGRRTPSIVLALGAFVLLASAGLAQGSYDLSWWTVDAGGGTASGGSYTLTGTIGQPDTGTLTGGDHTLSSGFWGVGVAAAECKVHLPLVLRQ